MNIFKLPDLGEGLPDAEIVEWHVKVGDTIEAGETLVSVETAKAIIDVPSPQSGRIARLYGGEGDVIETGKPLAAFGDEAPDADEAPRAKDSGTVVGEMESTEDLIPEAATDLHYTGSTVRATPAVASKASARPSRLTPANNGLTAISPNWKFPGDDSPSAQSSCS